MKSIVSVLFLIAGCTGSSVSESKSPPRAPRNYSIGECFQIAEFKVKIIAVDSLVEKVVFVPFHDRFECYAIAGIPLDMLAMDTLAKIDCPFAKSVCKPK